MEIMKSNTVAKLITSYMEARSDYDNFDEMLDFLTAKLALQGHEEATAEILIALEKAIVMKYNPHDMLDFQEELKKNYRKLSNILQQI